MRLTLRCMFLYVCVINVVLSMVYESEDIVPVRINGRGRGRFWKRSEEQPRITLSAFGEDFTLNLTPYSSFIAPSFTIQRVSAKHVEVLQSAPGAQRQDVLDDSIHKLRGCFYSGNVDYNQDSVVAVSLCNGIFGSFINEGKEYVIEPKQFGLGLGAIEQLHVIKRRIHNNTAHRGPLSPGHHTEESPAEWDKDLITRGLRDARRKPRHKRFVSSPRFIETLVVADASMTQFYGDEIKHYILTLVSMAAQLYQHPSIKNSVHLVVVKMLVVEDEEVGPAVSSNGGLSLLHFCSWQQPFNPPSPRHPEHYDTALLFTREDICGYHSCETVGVADVGTMCDPKRSCLVVEDNGLQAAFTVAHELGHVLSMPHDDSKTCERLFGALGGQHLMAPVILNLSRTAPWSPCSALYVTEFFDNGHGDCLLDAPETAMPLPRGLPGHAFSLDRQCQQVFGEEFLRCPNTSDSEACAQLWCHEEGGHHCTTKNGTLPWADGTACPNGTCLHGTCRPTQDVLQPRVVVDGGWGPWGPWRECSRTCGGGVEFSYRECQEPVPQNGGRYCEGQRVQYRSCNPQPCEDSDGKSFREQQCEKYNSPHYLDFNGQMKQWIPKYAGVSPRDRCKLFCITRDSSEFKVFQAKVIDGTTCGPDTTSVCVQGQCVKAGCDQLIGSNKKFDKCGVCREAAAHELTCMKITGSYSKARYGYSDIVTIPVGATNIDIKQRSHRGVRHDGHYLAVKRAKGSYVLNGNFSVSTLEQDIPVQGATLKYSGSSTTLERIQGFRRLREALTIQLLVLGGHSIPPKVKYTFFIPRDTTFSGRAAEERPGTALSPHMLHPLGQPQWVLGEWSQWVLGEWSQCSKSCGSGWSRRNVDCLDGAGFRSGQCDRDLKPVDVRPCGDAPCPMWQMGPWSACSRTCGAGARRRSVFCTEYTGNIVEAAKCDPAKMPEPVSGECLDRDCACDG